MRALALLVLGACTGTITSAVDAPFVPDAASPDAAPPPDAALDASPYDCAVFGAPGQCLTVNDCAALGGHTPYTGHCTGATLECCIKTPSTADNPPVPAGWKLMMQSEVTAEMTAWAVMILHDTTDYPMFSTTILTFGTKVILARVEWHAPDFQNGVVHRGVTLYEMI
jgi:hypothetical protein